MIWFRNFETDPPETIVIFTVLVAIGVLILIQSSRLYNKLNVALRSQNQISFSNEQNSDQIRQSQLFDSNRMIDSQTSNLTEQIIEKNFFDDSVQSTLFLSDFILKERLNGDAFLSPGSSYGS